MVRPRGVVLLGATAGQAVFGASFRVGASRGQIPAWPDVPELAAPPEFVAHGAPVIGAQVAPA